MSLEKLLWILVVLFLGTCSAAILFTWKALMG